MLPIVPSPLFMCYYAVKCKLCTRVSVWDKDPETDQEACDLDPYSLREMSLDGSKPCQKCLDCGNWKRVYTKG